jgi:ergothioneine biosynthesis protein EgtB
MIVDRFVDVRNHTEALAAPLSAEDQTVQSMPDASPTKWHRAHTTWFFETFLLQPFAPSYETFDPAYRYLFNSYYEAVGPRHPRHERGLLSRPGIEEVAAYRRHVDAAMVDLLGGNGVVELSALLDLGLHHEQQHQELLLMDIKHVLAASPLKPAYAESSSFEPQAPRPSVPRGDAPPWLYHPGGVVEIGAQGEQFCFDNETPRHEVLLRPFAISARLVTCGEWLEFVDDGGYRRPDLWMSEGWAAVNAAGWASPAYWERSERAAEWSVFTLHGLEPLDAAAPIAHISWYEADAFARWADARLPLEAEWEVAASATQRAGQSAPRAGPGAADDEQWFAQVWQWTASPYAGYPGFRSAPGAVGEYNGKFMVNQHVLRGSASVTSPGHSRVTYRNFFPAGSRWAFSGLRLARDLT